MGLSALGVKLEQHGYFLDINANVIGQSKAHELVSQLRASFCSGLLARLELPYHSQVVVRLS